MDLIYNGQSYLFLIIFVMLIAGMIKDNNLFIDLFSYLKNNIKSNRGVVTLFSALSGILPITGRVTVSAGLLDTIAPKDKNKRSKFGPIDFLSTHHYYFWSPLEKTVILPMAAFSLTYANFIAILWPLLLVSFLYLTWYLFFIIKENDISIKQSVKPIKISRITRYLFPYILGITGIISGLNFIWVFGLLSLYYMIVTQTFDYKKLLGYVDWKIVIWVASIIIAANYTTKYTSDIKDLISTIGIDITSNVGFIAISILAFFSSFALGSSSRFGAITVILTSLYGLEYLIWFFAVDFAGYILSPMHKCVAIGKMYFGTKLSYYVKLISGWALLLVLTAGILLNIR